MKPEATKSPRELAYEAACTSAKSEFENMDTHTLKRKLEMLNKKLGELKKGGKGMDGSTVAMAEAYRDTAASLLLQHAATEPTQIPIPALRGDASFFLLRKFFRGGKRG